MSYAEILSKVKKDDTLKEIGQSISKIRRTMAGDIILLLDQTSQGKTTQFCTAIESALGNEAAIKSKTQQTSVEIKDLDEVTMKEEVRE